MGKQKQYEGAVDSVFDFIFANSKSKSKPLRYRPTGMSGADEMTKALAAIAGNPALMITQQGMEHINETLLSAKLFEFRLDYDKQYDETINPQFDKNASRVRVRFSDLGKVANDPNKFVDGIYKKMQQERALSKTFLPAMMFGMDQALTAGYAKKNGMNISDALKLSKSAQIRPDQQMLDMNRELIGQNAAINHEIRKIKSELERSGLDPKSPAFASAVQDEIRRRGNDIKKRSDDFANLLQENKEMRNLDLMREYKAKKPDDDKSTDSPLYTSFNANKASLRSDLINKKGMTGAEADALITSLERELRGNVGHGISTYRTNLYKNYDYKAAIASSLEDRERLHRSKAIVLGYERFKGNGERASGNIDASIKELKGIIKSTDDPRLKQQYQGLLGELNTLKKTGDDTAGKASSFWAGTPSRGNEKYNAEVFQRQLRVEEISLNKRIREAKQSGDAFEVKMLQAQRQQLRSFRLNAQGVPGQEWRYRFANVDAFRKSFQTVAQGGLGPGLMNGTIFMEPVVGSAAPGTFGDVSFLENRGRDKDGNLIIADRFSAGGKYSVDFKKGDGTIDSYKPENIIVPRNTPYGYGELASLYYFTPISMLKTVAWNGEGFHYLAHRRVQSLQMDLAKEANVNALKSIFGGFNEDQLKKLGFGKDFTADADGFAGNYLAVIEHLKVLESEGKLSPEMKSLLKKVSRKYNLGSRFSRIGAAYNRMGPWRVTQNLASSISGFFWEKMGLKATTNNILMRLSSNEIWTEAVGKFMGGGIGLSQLLRTGITTAANAVGVVFGGPIGQAALGIITWVATGLLMKLSKPFMQIFMTAMVGLMIVVCAIPFVIEGFFSRSNVAATAMEPGIAQICGVEIYPGDPVDPTPGVGDGEVPPDAICPVNIGAVCNQGPNGTWSHSKMGTLAIDLGVNAGVWKAPSDGTVTQSVASMDCEWDPGNNRGGQMVFQDTFGNTYRLLHADPLVGTGPVSQGTPIARMSTGLPRSLCWTGAHYHLEVQSGGGYMNSLQWYNDLSCGIQGC